MSDVGHKADAGKLRWATLLPWDALEQVVRVLEFGAVKYSVDNWRHVPDARYRYRDALLRHTVAMIRGEDTDPESDLPHAAHAACCALFLVALERAWK